MAPDSIRYSTLRVLYAAAAATNAATHLIGLGHERSAMITGNLRLPPHFNRLEGFRCAMQEYHLPIRNEYLRSELQTESA